MSEQPKAARPKKTKNALKHGVYSREPMLPGEKIRDYAALAAELDQEWTPDGPTEQGLVDRLLSLKWRRQRLDRYEQIRMRQEIDAFDEKNEINRHRQNLRRLGLEIAAAPNVEAVEKILARLSPDYQDIITEGAPREKCEDASKWGQAINAYLSRLTSPAPVEGDDKFAAIVNSDVLERELARADRIDEAIDRTIKRLMQVKTAKQVFPSMRRNARPDQGLINLPAPYNSSGTGCKPEQKGQLLGKVENSANREVYEVPAPIDYNQAILRIS